MPSSTTIAGANARFALFVSAASRASSATSATTSKYCTRIRTHIIGRFRKGIAPGNTSEGAIVVTLTANGDAATPFGVTDALDAAQVDSEGAPVQLSVTVPWNPLTGVTCRLYVAGCPALTVAVFEPPAATSIEESVPVPASETICGLRPAPSAIATLAARFPVAVGLNVTLIEQFAPDEAAHYQAAAHMP
jgi:hypothetical protein